MQRRWNCLRHILRRGCERLFYSIGVDTGRSKGKREKDCQKRERQGGVEELGQGGGRQQGGLGRQCDSLMRLLAQ